MPGLRTPADPDEVKTGDSRVFCEAPQNMGGSS